MDYTADSVQIQIVSNGGPIKEATWKAGGALVPGSFVTKHASNGTVSEAVTTGSLDAIVLDSAEGAGGFVAIQEVDADTIFEVQVNGGNTPDDLSLNSSYVMAVTNGIVNITTTAGTDLKVVDYGKYYDRSTHAGTDLNGFVKVKLA